MVFEARVAIRYEQTDELKKLSSFAFTPNFVFLDPSGRKVLERRGFSTPREARALHEFVSQRRYEKTTFQEFLASYPGA